MKITGIDLALLLLPMTVAGQIGGYARSVGDTLRYHEISVSESVIESPNGVIETSSSHDAVLGITFAAEDRASAWYESLRLSQTGPMGTVEPHAPEVLGQSFSLEFDMLGRITVLATPTFPEEVASVTDLTHQFDDLFLILPPRALAIGTSWVDTLVSTASGDTSRTVYFRRIDHKEVVRDTVIDGHRAWVIASRQDLSMEVSGPVPGQNMTMDVEMTGEDEGHYVWDIEGRSMWSRHRTGQMEGMVNLSGAMGQFAMPQRRTYRNEVTRR